LVANEIEEQFLETYVANVHCEAVHGDIRSAEISAEIVHRAKRLRAELGAMPLWILGGPPCQGFSTAGKRRSIDDERNHLFRDYIHLLKVLKPDGFVFENVTGLLNMEQGSVFRDLSAAFRPLANAFGYWILNAEEHAIPQRRSRVVLIGVQTGERVPAPPAPITGSPDKSNLFGGTAPWVTADEALSDLPALSHGQDGSQLPYASAPMNSYQAFMRGLIDAGSYLERVATGLRGWP
jgi:DNA (cytosine-5)-methyltransferase 1